jgi:hypothetical protein
VTIPQHVTDAVLRTCDDHAKASRAIADALTCKAPKAKSLIAMHRNEQHAFELLREHVAAGLLEQLTAAAEATRGF